ncbi:CfaE/CblD family pilus tip adhesin [Stenotrophomonas maltophilia]|uniref:CfaE/CblD family pilus tip adhesin n=1 Tax=Stenotrophomonas maltophilia TaxID=40324 RepID=UPI0039C49D16
MPGDIELWSARTVLGFSDDASYSYGGLHLTCRSSTNSETGRCPSLGTEGEQGIGHISLLFTEIRSGQSTELVLDGYLNRAMPGRRCSGDFWANNVLPPWSASVWECATEWPIGTGVGLTLPIAEVERLVAGHWRASLQLGLHDSLGAAEIADYTFNFDFTITDHNAVSIYFPQFHSTTPLVNLDARYDPIRQTVGGRTVVDMCLYDGLGSQASYLAVTARDISPRSAGGSGFSLWHDSSGSDPSQRLDYTVTLDHNGARVPLNNGVEEQLTGIDSSQLRLVMLPGMSQPVFCVNTPMTLDMPRVPSTSKRSGIYWGDLQLELRVPAGVP